MPSDWKKQIEEKKQQLEALRKKEADAVREARAARAARAAADERAKVLEETAAAAAAAAAAATEKVKILKEAQRLRQLRLEAEAKFTEEEKRVDRHLKGCPIGGLFYEKLRKERWEKDLEEWNSPEAKAGRDELLRRQGDEAADIGYVRYFGINVWEPDYPTLWAAWVAACVHAFKTDRLDHWGNPNVENLKCRVYFPRSPYSVRGHRDSQRLEDQGTGLLGTNLTNTYDWMKIFYRDPESRAPEPPERVGKHFRKQLFFMAIRGEDPVWCGEPFTGKDLEVFEEFKAFLRTEGIEV